MGDVLAIFLLIGVAHWAVHILQCPECKRIIDVNIAFLLEGSHYTFGWPMHFMRHMKALFGKNKDDETSFTPMLKFERLKGESMEDFIARATKEGIEHLEKEYKK